MSSLLVGRDSYANWMLGMSTAEGTKLLAAFGHHAAVELRDTIDALLGDARSARIDQLEAEVVRLTRSNAALRRTLTRRAK